VAKAFGVPIDTDPRALAILHEWWRRPVPRWTRRVRLTRIPKGADLISASTIKERLSLALSRRKQGFESPRARQ